MVKLPGGFSPLNAVKQFGSIVNPTGGVTDYDVFSDISVWGGNRGPADGSFVGATPTSGLSYADGSPAPTPSIGQMPAPTGTFAPDTSFVINSGSPDTVQGGYRAPSQTLDAQTTAPTPGGGVPQATGNPQPVAPDPLELNRINQQTINAGADATKSKLSNLLRTLDPQEAVAKGKVLNQFQTANNDLLRSRATGRRNLNYADQQVQGEKIRNLRTLGDQIRQMNFSYANQLGAFGAGDSSAAALISNAVAQQGANNRGDIMRGASDQQTQIGFQRDDLEQAFTTNMGKLDEWKQRSLADIVTSFSEKKNAIQEAMQTADATRYAELAQLDAQFTSQALDTLKGLESTYEQQANDLIAKFKNILGPQDAQMPVGLGQYAVNPVDAGQLQGLEMPRQVNPEDNLTAILKRRDEQELTV